MNTKKIYLVLSLVFIFGGFVLMFIKNIFKGYPCEKTKVMRGENYTFNCLNMHRMLHISESLVQKP